MRRYRLPGRGLQAVDEQHAHAAAVGAGQRVAAVDAPDVAEHDGAKLNVSTAKCVTCARALAGAEITVAVCATDAAAVAAEAAQLAGVTRVLTLENPANAHALAAVLAPQVAALAGPFTLVLGPSTTFGKDLMPRVAALLDTAQVSDIMAVESATRFRRPPRRRRSRARRRPSIASTSAASKPPSCRMA